MTGPGGGAHDRELRELLRSLPVFAGPLPPVDPDVAADPVSWFRIWLAAAVDAGIQEPHAMVLSTVDPAGRPDARTLIVKSVAADGRWRFAGPVTSRKGQDLAISPHAALTFYWPPLGRQVRVRGPVEERPAAERDADYAARPSATPAGREGWRLWEVRAAEVEFLQASADRRHVRVAFVRDGESWRRETR